MDNLVKVALRSQTIFSGFLFVVSVISWPFVIDLLSRASDISRKKTENFAGFSGASSRKNRPISRDFRGKKVKIRSKIGQFRGIFTGEKSKFTEKPADFAGF